MTEKQFYVYLLASQTNGTLYVGVTSNLIQRIWQHREGLVDGFTKKYKVKILVWYEVHQNAEAGITREKQINEWKRKWKLKLIADFNPTWRDLYEEICQ